MTQEIRHIDPDKLLEANRDYMGRAEQDGVYLVYDATLDTLFVQFGGPREALSEHVVDNVMLRIDPETLEIVGFEILDFFSDFLPNNRLVREALGDLELREGEDSEVTLMEPRFKPLREQLEAMIPYLAHSVGA